MNDISDIWTEALTSELGIKRSEFKVLLYTTFRLSITKKNSGF